MEFDTVNKVAPVLNHFYELYDVAYHERFYYRSCGAKSRKIVKDYKRGSKAVRDYVENSDKPLEQITKEELMNVFRNALN